VRRADFIGAAVLTGGLAVILAVHGLFDSPSMLLDSLSVLLLGALVGWRRRHPVIVAAAAGALLVVLEFTADASSVYETSAALSALGSAAVFLYAYALGSGCPWELSLVGMVPLTVGVAVTVTTYIPIVGMVTIGPWLAGLLVASKRRVAAQLESRARELDQEREVFAAESVRYERARIARELHDIVAHCVSLMVVQAGAGERLVAGDPESAAEVFGSIGEVARQAEVEIDRLTKLLKTSTAASPLTGLRIVEDLVNRVQASGLRVSFEFSGEIEDLPEESAEAAYRLVQEALTNAMKHAPGAPIAVTIQGSDSAVYIHVVNEQARFVRSGLEELGGSHGLSGMRERIARCGGTLSAGPTTDRGWRVDAALPRQVNHAAAADAL
jgi:signal transduction histidine kinase